MTEPDGSVAADGFGGDGDSGHAGGAGEPLTAAAGDDRSRVNGVVSRLRNLEKRFRVLHAAQLAVAAEQSQPGAPAAGAKSPVYPTLADYVREYFAPTYTRPLHSARWNWCPFWWEHTEAVSRLQALWKAWEALHADPAGGFGDWYRDHLDHQLPILMGPDGPFRDCVDRHWPTEDGDLLRCADPPPDNRVWQRA